ncbi:hypothetical protein AGABI2DRAFT_203891 [Agaricus bisporus var. bisporus H97]|uniref:hypothetical protein n=1 Tax=Agaricus bisporus var. bisporus (strain H97 / ATCC MYA-4626 / FGSC 10389) TaxID=936046 RepID=UPI00029F5EEC|nr:hypothetical protein AGABI2DRAFT_203891 [Agaricus bisporus var. bisporus H97]EKV47073.1 hypothetical protein AGABI2DRAFT_203891 [Agaricus bisporus var. bisporus H97]
MYLYELPTTGNISFSDLCIDQSPGRTYTTCILEATQARANIRTALKGSKRTEDNAKDFLSLTKVLEDYLPLIRGLINCADQCDIDFKSKFSFSWRSTLSNNILNNSPRVEVPGLYADLAFTLLTYAFTLSNLAHATVQSIGAYELDRTITKVQRERKDEQLNVAFGLLCKASGIFSYIADTLLSEWETSGGGGSDASKLPSDLKQEVLTALSKLALADAQSLAIRKRLSKAAFENNIAPGPPLPSSHPPVSFIAKLHLECASLYGSAKTLAKAGGNNISSEIRKYLTDRIAFHTALSHKWLGIEAGEKGGMDRAGDAVAFLAWAKEELETLKDSNPSLHIVKGDKEKTKRSQLLDELESTDTFYTYYKKMNDSLHFQSLPTQADLKSRIPAGLAAAQMRPYTPPSPAFGPGSLEDVDRQTGGPEIGDELTESPASRKGPSNYAGAGSYF